MSPLAVFATKAIAAREKLIREGKGNLGTAEGLAMINDLKRFLQFYGNKGDEVIKRWLEREHEKVDKVFPPTHRTKLRKLLQA